MGAPTFAFGGNEHLAEILDRVSDGFVALDLDWRFTYINRAAEQYFGAPRDQLLGKVAWDLFPEGVGPTVAQEYLRAVAGTAPVEFEVLSPVKNNWVAHRIYPSGSGATIYFRDVSAERGTSSDGSKLPVAVSSALSIVDLSERKRSEQAMKLLADGSAELSQSLERDEILRRVTSLIVPRVADVCIVELWDGERLRRKAIQHRDPEKLSRWSAEGLAGAGRVMQSGASELIASVTDDGEGLQTLGVRSALRVPLRVAGKVTGIVSLFIVDDDIDDDVDDDSRCFAGENLPVIEALADRAALALENARLYEIAAGAKRVRGDLLAMVSHDLRNSLNAIGFIATELARQGGSPLATQIRSAATLADRLLADLGAMFAIESGSLVLGRFTESVDSIMNEVADLFRPLADARAIRLRAVTERKGLTAFVDRHRMVQALSNVVANAVEISEEGGQVDLAAKQVGDDVELAISDTGPGIAPGEVERMFDRTRWGNDGRRRASVGLGLVISKEYVEAHGGRIRVQSQPGSGSTFTIAIPMRARGTAAEPPGPRRATVPSR
ncbi:MAG TPA: ATP-binding protein [Polyangia bacterium]|jgi:signal transduction histidine kinase|nr:ATP-binding protein [Polyangia bacterium]